MAKSMIVERWEFETERGKDGAVFKIAGQRGCERVKITVHKPGIGYGHDETPDQNAEIEMLVAEWNEIVELVKHARGG